MLWKQLPGTYFGIFGLDFRLLGPWSSGSGNWACHVRGGQNFDSVLFYCLDNVRQWYGSFEQPPTTHSVWHYKVKSEKTRFTSVETWHSSVTGQAFWLRIPHGQHQQGGFFAFVWWEKYVEMLQKRYLLGISCSHQISLSGGLSGFEFLFCKISYRSKEQQPAVNMLDMWARIPTHKEKEEGQYWLGAVWNLRILVSQVSI